MKKSFGESVEELEQAFRDLFRAFFQPLAPLSGVIHWTLRQLSKIQIF